MVAGRGNEGRAVASVATTSGSQNITGPANSFQEEDAGRAITGTGIPASTTISAVVSPTQATLSQNASATGTVTATLGAIAAVNQGFFGWSPESDSESESYSVAANNAGTPVDPARPTNAITSVVDRRSRG